MPRCPAPICLALALCAAPAAASVPAGLLAGPAAADSAPAARMTEARPAPCPLGQVRLAAACGPPPQPAPAFDPGDALPALHGDAVSLAGTDLPDAPAGEGYVQVGPYFFRIDLETRTVLDIVALVDVILR
ncbi:hypothetical protein E2L08_01415 [Palleronia sediminis]|uniref:Uncharacterized protein n=1 Tax=Palleronia sediminis TaxID=2547833 RepID=A0A4R6AQ49_9RHOB|nr:hypothetical protein [Palleronia sediminis]TDL84156.1 hypothetical protein E2L08_01415 [Palleronia sediminis]